MCSFAIKSAISCQNIESNKGILTYPDGNAIFLTSRRKLYYELGPSLLFGIVQGPKSTHHFYTVLSRYFPFRGHVCLSPRKSNYTKNYYKTVLAGICIKVWYIPISLTFHLHRAASHFGCVWPANKKIEKVTALTNFAAPSFDMYIKYNKIVFIY